MSIFATSKLQVRASDCISASVFVVVAFVLVHLCAYLQPQNYKLGHQIVLVHLCLWLMHQVK